VTVIASGECPVSGVTVSHPCGDDDTATVIGRELVAAGRVAVSFAGAGNAALLTWYVKLNDAGLTVGPPDWAAATPAKQSRGSRCFIPASSAVLTLGFKGFKST
jgi:hypothetical protein